MIILRRLIAQELELKSRINSQKLYQGVTTLNKSIMNDYFNCDKPAPDKEENVNISSLKFYFSSSANFSSNLQMFRLLLV